MSSAFFSSSTPSAYTVSYSHHCSSIVQESTPTFRAQSNPLPYFETSYFTGGDRLLGKKPSNQNQSYYYVGKSLTFPVSPYYYETRVKGIYKVEAYLFIRSPYRYYSNARRNYTNGGSYYRRSRTRWSGSVRSLLNGFWSENSRKLCMVGSATWEYAEGRALNLDVLLKLNYASDNPTIYTSVVSGTFESRSSSDDLGYFDPISIFSFPVLTNYNYSLVSKELDGGFSGGSKVPKNQSLSLQPNRFCSMLSGRLAFFELEYAAECKTAKYCSLLGGGDKFLPRFVSLNPIQCYGDDKKLRYMVTFQNISYAALYQTFGVNSTLIGEASWDDSNNQLFIVACPILDPSNHLGNAVGDCTIRLSLRYPSIWNIRNDAKIVGQIWTNKTVDDSGYFRKIKLTSPYDNDVVASQGLRYEYSELDRVRKLCPGKKLVKNTGDTYPDGHSYDMRFDMSVKNGKGQKFAWGEAIPLSVGNELYEGNHVLVAVEPMTRMSGAGFATMSEPEKSTNAPLNISYKISISPFPEVKVSNWFPTINWSMNLRGQVEITAEGVYDAETGHLCMVGCRKLLSYVQKSTNDSRDCEILVNFEFARLNDRRGGLIKGTIQSTRTKADYLYFDDLSLSSAAFYPAVAKQSIWRMDLEITMVLISNTLLCIFVGLQLFHIKRNPDALSGISLVMLLILSVGHLIPLVLNFEAMFLGNIYKQRLWLSNMGWLEANEVAVRVVTMVAFLLQIRLLQLVWTVKVSEGNEKGLWLGEKKAGFISLPIYILGGLLTLVLNRTRNSYGHQAGSAEKALSAPFYIGTSTVRLVPHAYDQYRAHNFPTSHVNGTYYYANPTADFYSTAWDIIIPCGVIALAVIIFLQQRHGGRCILPKRFRELELYEKVPVSNNE
ncbi:hypothetical protein Pfo_014126 [Paulownia fortunei]|nr:hypothetical protein Pfo_014126 [Paulownia fortunei]